MRGNGDVLEPFDPWRPYRSPKAVTPDHPRFVKWEEAQPVFASIYYRFSDIASRPSFTETEVWRRFDRYCH